jgi:hypothetical protein
VGNYLEEIWFVMNGKHSGFFETSKKILDNYSLNSINFSNVEMFECNSCTNPLNVKKVYRVKNIGVVSFEFVSGEIWINENLTKTGNTTKDSYDYSENTCE